MPGRGAVPTSGIELDSSKHPASNVKAHLPTNVLRRAPARGLAN